MGTGRRSDSPEMRHCPSSPSPCLGTYTVSTRRRFSFALAADFSLFLDPEQLPPAFCIRNWGVCANQTDMKGEPCVRIGA